MTRSKPFTDPVRYDELGPGSKRSAEVVAPMVVALLSPSSVVDFGSGTGAWLAAFLTAGVNDVCGLEGGTPDPSQLLIDADLIRRADFEEPVDVGRRFDLAMSVEVAEHLPAERAPLFVESIAHHADAVLFSAAVPGQGGTHHINERWPAYWAELFADHGFDCFDPLRAALWDDERVEWWYRQNLLLFARGDAAGRLRERGQEPGQPRALVHPVLYERLMTTLHTAGGIRAQLRGLVSATGSRLRPGR